MKIIINAMDIMMIVVLLSVIESLCVKILVSLIILLTSRLFVSPTCKVGLILLEKKVTWLPIRELLPEDRLSSQLKPQWKPPPPNQYELFF